MIKSDKAKKICRDKSTCCEAMDLGSELKAAVKLVKKTASKAKAKYDAQDETTKKNIKKGVGIAVAGLAGIMLAKKMSKKK